MQTILGIDPGSRCTGYGIITSESNKLRCLAYGEIKMSANLLMPVRLHMIFTGLQKVIHDYLPHEVAIEKVFMYKNAQSAIKLGQARGAAMVAAASLDLPVAQYAPREIKQAVVGYGNADKNQMQQMMKILLGLDKLPGQDAADALAVALCHCNSSKLKAKVS